jgi:hypothetical protein
MVELRHNRPGRLEQVYGGTTRGSYRFIDLITVSREQPQHLANF